MKWEKLVYKNKYNETNWTKEWYDKEVYKNTESSLEIHILNTTIYNIKTQKEFKTYEFYIEISLPNGNKNYLKCYSFKDEKHIQEIKKFYNIGDDV